MWSSSSSVLTGGAVELAKNFTNDKPYKGKVTSTLVYGVQWDMTLKFLNDEEYLKDSTGKGWYETSIHNTGIDVDEKASNKIKNIYDMAGNVYEWTMEKGDGANRIRRGGCNQFSANYSPASSRNRATGTSTYGSTGFRIALYL